jgi:EH_Signature domain
MTLAEPCADLDESIKGLQLALQTLKAELALPPISVESRFRNLSAVIKALGQTKPTRPISNTSEYLDQWKDVLAGGRQNLEPRAVRSLCWNAAVALDQSFQDYLDNAQCVPHSQSLQGLICSCHARWSREFALSQSVARIRNRLNQYSGRNRLLQKWKSSAEMIIGPKAHDLMAGGLIASTEGLAGFCDYWGLSIESSQLFQSAAEIASVLCLEQVDRVPKYQEFLFNQLMPWPGWAANTLKNVMRRLIMFPKRENTELIDAIIHLVRTDRRFGDPRHPQNHNNWIGLDEASRRVQEWMSAADITFFFETVLPKSTDPHGRKGFWLRYVGCRGLRSRPLLSNSDKYRLRDVLSKKRTKASDFGRLLDEDTSAFILDFGPLLVIEFSSVGNACYVYERPVAAEIVPDIWTNMPFHKSDLKRRPKVATGQPITHDRQNRWKIEMERFLARYGIRAVS